MAAPRLKEMYRGEVRKKLQDEFKIENVMAIPKVEKVVLNMGVGEAIQNMKVLDTAVEELATITGQRPMITRAKKSIVRRRHGPVNSWLLSPALTRLAPRRVPALFTTSPSRPRLTKNS